MEKQKVKEIYDPGKKEPYWQKFWKEKGVNKFDPESTEELFTIDTPPPTISGALHLGHVFSYSQAEVIARFRRLAGFNVRYPIGFDNNGLPTERLVEKEKNVQGRNLPLAEFVKICLEVTDVYKEKYKNLWKSLGLSVDWSLEYSTISAEAQKLAQTVFKELFNRGAIYQKKAPALYCPTCRTSVAQAEVEDKEMAGVFYDIVFKTSEEKELLIATTRPELLPACAAVFVHPDDKRYKKLIGGKAVTPLGREIPILADDKVSMEKGTGAVMCCTYGDETDVYWTRRHKLPERIILDKEGKLIALKELPELASKSVSQARGLIVAKLKEAGAVKKEEKIKHDVGAHERCGTAIELVPTKQWFVKILDKKEELMEAGKQIKWHPDHMRKRYEDWVAGLKWDWCISRERFFGVPIPAYVCDSCAEVFIPNESAFPIDPKLDKTSRPCPKCKKGNLVPEQGVLDTWFTSALTPDINNNLPANGRLAGRMYPMSMRPQAHDIIRTWVVYSILMAIYRHQNIPWRELMISGHILLQKGEKISKKTGGGKLKPEEFIKTYSADAIRYAMYGASLGRDAFYDEQEVKKGKRLVLKLYNAGKFIIGSLRNFETTHAQNEAKLEPIDRWIISRCLLTAKNMAEEFEQYEYNRARQAFEDFFWKDLCDNYLEIVKGRLRLEGEADRAKRASAQQALCRVYLDVLKMISPLLPHISEEMYHAKVSPTGETVSRANGGFFADREKKQSVHQLFWPASEPTNLLNESEIAGAKLMLAAIAEVRKYKSAHNLNMGASLPPIILKGKADQKKLLGPFRDDLTFVTRAEKIFFSDQEPDDSAEQPIISI